MDVITVGSLADIVEAVATHVGPAYVMFGAVESIRQAAAICDILTPLVFQYEWSTGKLAAISFAAKVEKQLDQIASVVLPRLRLHLATPDIDPMDGLRFLAEITGDVKDDAEFASFSLMDNVNDLDGRAATALDLFKEHRDVDALNIALTDIDLLVGTIRDSLFTFTAETSSSSSSSDGDGDGEGDIIE